MDIQTVKKMQAQSRDSLVIGLAGNPNSGKTSMFNNLTGARQQVGNWPGVTVERKEGRLIYKGSTLRVVDLPGTYGLAGGSEDEVIARDFILNERPDVIINVVDSTNLERNLYLTIQLLEMGAPVVLALNMSDEAENKGYKIDAQKLSEKLGVPVVFTTASRNQGTEQLVEEALSIAGICRSPLMIDYGSDIEKAVRELESQIYVNDILAAGYPPRWLAVKLLENESIPASKIKCGHKLRDRAGKLRDQFQSRNVDPESVIVSRRHAFISSVAGEVLSCRPTETVITLSDRIDMVVTNRFLGIPIFMAAMWAVFKTAFAVGDPLIGVIEAVLAVVGNAVAAGLTAVGAPAKIIDLTVDGIIGGVGSVITFVPPIFTVFLAISILEDSGYMARGAYIMDRFMQSIGLNGKAFIPMIIGFGCNVPAIMAARTLENKKDRIITILINPFMSCSARFPVYVLFAGAFFSSRYQGTVIFSIYLLGIVLAVLTAKLLSVYVLKSESSYLVMELPPYRLPTFKGALSNTWVRVGAFLKKASTVIFAGVVLIWVLSNLPVGVDYASRDSLVGMFGSVLAPLLEPAGFGNWQAATALMFGLIAKESVISTLAVVYGVGQGSLSDMLINYWTPLSAYSFMVMTLLYIPCMATVAVIKKETGSWKWAAAAICGSLLIGWTVSVLVYQVGRLLGAI